MKTCKCGRRAYALFRLNNRFVRKLGKWIEVGNFPEPFCKKCLQRHEEAHKHQNYCYWIIGVKDQI